MDDDTITILDEGDGASEDFEPPETEDDAEVRAAEAAYRDFFMGRLGGSRLE